MPESFFELPAAGRREILTTCSAIVGRRDAVLEKDVWVCWALSTAFSIPGRPQMAFKGGTSLSKVFNAISRFSEDIDITLGFRQTGVPGFEGFDPLAEGVSGNQIKRYSQALTNQVAAFTRGPALEHVRSELGKVADNSQVSVHDNGETIEFVYPTVFDSQEDDYLKNRVLIEFGGRNVIIPNDVFDVTPDIREHVGELILPSARVTVLDLERTFWEKATLAHFENNRPQLREDKLRRMSRHWYDLWRIYTGDQGEAAAANRELLADVVVQKKLFYRSGFADYDACLSKGFRLLPEGDLLAALQADFAEMRSAAMFYGETPEFDVILEELRPLQEQLNA